MIITKFANAVVGEIDSKIEVLTDDMRRGIRDQNEYWRVVGIAQGLDAIKLYVKDLANKVEREDDDN